MTDALDLIEELLKDASVFSTALELTHLDGEGWAGRAGFMLMKAGRESPYYVYATAREQQVRIIERNASKSRPRWLVSDKQGFTFEVAERELSGLTSAAMRYGEKASDYARKSGTTEIEFEGGKIVSVTKHL